MRLQAIEKDQAGEELQRTFDAIEDTYGMVPNIFRVMAHAPQVLEAILELNNAMRGDLPPTYCELAYLAASRVNDCEYCSTHHAKAAQQAGWSQEQVAAVGTDRAADLFNDEEQTVIRFAEELTRTTRVDADTVTALKTFLSNQQLVELMAVVGLANFTNRFNHAFDVELP